MAVPTQTTVYNPFYSVMSGTDIDAGSYYITMTANSVNLNRGFILQTGTLTDMTVTVEDSADGTNFVDSSYDYLNVATAASNKAYKCELPNPARTVRIKAVRVDATNAVDLKVFCPR